MWFTLGIREAIKGWDKGLKDMCVGEKRKLTIPPALAYGKEGKGKTPEILPLLYLFLSLLIYSWPKSLASFQASVSVVFSGAQLYFIFIPSNLKCLLRYHLGCWICVCVNASWMCMCKPRSCLWVSLEPRRTPSTATYLLVFSADTVKTRRLFLQEGMLYSFPPPDTFSHACYPKWDMQERWQPCWRLLKMYWMLHGQKKNIASNVFCQ